MLVVAAGFGTAAAQTETRPAVVPTAPTEQSEIARLVQEKQLQPALERAEKFLAKEPRNAQVRFLRAVILADLGRTDEAIAAFEALMQDFPELPESYNNLAVIHAGEGRLEQARVLLERAIEAQPNYVTAHENLGDLHVAMAADAYRRASSLDPKSATLKAKLALAREVGTKLRSAR
ncbi:MAG TPA: tetratricopeptide repeat protein [Burkholderiaceae bacterium]|nr:tetratricopeptide repeat protein [Burkholderiaceae bacterium]